MIDVFVLTRGKSPQQLLTNTRHDRFWPRKVDVRLPAKRFFTLPWREAGPPNPHDDKVELEQQVVNKELSLSPTWKCGAHLHSKVDTCVSKSEVPAHLA